MSLDTHTGGSLHVTLLHTAMALYQILTASTNRVSCPRWSILGHNDKLSSMLPLYVSLLSQVGGGGKAESPRLQNRADPRPGHTAGAARASGLPTQVSSWELYQEGARIWHKHSGLPKGQQWDGEHC